MAGTHFKGPVESTLGFTVGGAAIGGTPQAFTDNTGGTPGSSVEAAALAVTTTALTTTAATISVSATAYTATALTTPTDSPSTADALRDNLVATTLADVTTNFTALQTRLALDRTDLTALFVQAAAHKVDIEGLKAKIDLAITDLGAASTAIATINDNIASLVGALTTGGYLT